MRLTDFLPIILTIVLSVSDAFWYGWVYGTKGWLKKSLFWEWRMYGEKWVPFYRLLIQWPLDLLALYLVYVYCGFWPDIMMLGAWYFMAKEFNFYAMLWKWKEMERFEREPVIVYWLKRLYFSGWFFFINGFTVRKFVISYIISWVFLIISILIK